MDGRVLSCSGSDTSMNFSLLCQRELDADVGYSAVKWPGLRKTEPWPSLPSRQLYRGHRPGEQRPGLEVPEVLPGSGILQPPQHPVPLRGLRLLLQGGQELLPLLLRREELRALRLLWVAQPSCGARGGGSFLGGCLVHISKGGVSDSYFSTRRGVSGGFHGGPVAKTLYSKCRGPRFDPWSGN